MGWERSGYGLPYFVVRKRINGKRVVIYGGKGEAGRRAEEEHNRRREDRAAARAEDLERDQLMREYEALVYELVQRVLPLYGFEKRRRRWVRKSRKC